MDERVNERSAARLRELVVEVLERMEREGRGAVDAACAEHPDLAEALRARIASLGELGLVGAPAGSPPERVGDFRLVEKIGSGGMGVVYRAVQESLGREVALKLIRPDVLYQDDARDRFARETSIIARLQHPGIVPIYTVGNESELPWYAMERVVGCTLAEALAEIGPRVRGGPDELTGRDLLAAIAARCGRPVPDGAPSPLFAGSWESAALRVVRLVADALEHAHGRGVLHRDLKPSNIMVTPEGRVMLVDFGLSQSEGEDSLTGTTDRLGSLPYMPPELLRDGPRALDARSDVYGLGVILYELLTLRRPFGRGAGGDGEAEGFPNVMAAILDGRPPRPRSFTKGLSWEAETVCLAAMEPDPRRRYATARELARDLENALERRPIEARRASVWLLGRRMAQRHPGAAAAAALALLLPTVVAVLLVRETRNVGAALAVAESETERAEENLAKSREQERRALENRDRALRAIDGLLMEVASEQLDHVPRVHELRKSLYAEARALYDELADETADDVELRLKAAEADLERAGLVAREGRADDTEAALRRIVDDLQPLLATGEFRVRRSHAFTLVNLSYAVRAQHREEEARALLDEAFARLEAIVRDFPDAADVAAVWIDALAEDVMYDRMRGQLEDGARRLRVAEEEARQLAEWHPAEGEPVLARVLHHRGAWLQREGDLGTAIELWSESLELLTRLSELDPEDEHLRIDASQVAYSLGTGYALTRRHAEAAEALAVAAREAEVVVRDHPEIHDYREQAARVAMQRGVLVMESGGDVGESLGYFDRAAEAYDAILDDQPANAEVQRRMGTTCVNLSKAWLEKKDVERAAAACERARGYLEEATRLEPADPETHKWVGMELVQRTHVLMRAYRFVDGAWTLVEAPAHFARDSGRLSEVATVMTDVLEVAGMTGEVDLIDECRAAARRLESELAARTPYADAALARLRPALDP